MLSGNDDRSKALIGNEPCGRSYIEPASLAVAALWPPVELALDRPWEHLHITRHGPSFGVQQLLISKDTDGSASHRPYDSGFLVRLACSRLRRCQAPYRPARRNNPPARCPGGGDQHDLQVTGLGLAVGKRCISQSNRTSSIVAPVRGAIAQGARSTDGKMPSSIAVA